MDRFAKVMNDYLLAHQDTRNVVLHCFGVPMVVFSIFVPLSWFRFSYADVPFTAATILFLGSLPYYYKLDRVLTAGLISIGCVLLYLAELVASLPFTQAFLVFIGATIGGWGIQFLGHKLERKKPSLSTNFAHVFTGPLFVVTMIFLILGLRQDLRGKLNLSRST